MQPDGQGADGATSAPNVSAKDYNEVFENYVVELDQADVDLVGLLAYALYKRQKREWIIGYRARHDNERPDHKALATITENYLTSDMRRTLRDRAEDLLSNYAQVYVDASEQQIREIALSGETLRQAQAIEAAITRKSSFWSQVWTGIVASFISAGIIALVLLAAKVSGSPVLDALFPAQ